MTDFIKTEKSVIMVGDFNLDFMKRDVQNYPQRRLYDELLEMTYAFDLSQMVVETTWSRVYNGLLRTSVLDHVYTNNDELVSTITVEKQTISDHSAVEVTSIGKYKKHPCLLRVRMLEKLFKRAAY